jgi:hypothetical protein
MSPIVGTSISVNVDTGSQTGPDRTTYTTDAAGQFDVYLSVSGGSWVTLTFQKAGYVPLSTQLKGTPKDPVNLCLTATAPP